MVKKLEWSIAAAEAEARYWEDRRAGLEKDDPDMDVKSIDELRRTNLED